MLSDVKRPHSTDHGTMMVSTNPSSAHKHESDRNINKIERLKKIHKNLLIITFISILHNIFTFKTNMLVVIFTSYFYGTVLYRTVPYW